MIMEGPLGWYGAEVDTKRNEKHVQQKTCKRIMTRYDNRKARNIRSVQPEQAIDLLKSQSNKILIFGQQDVDM